MKGKVFLSTIVLGLALVLGGCGTEKAKVLGNSGSGTPADIQKIKDRGTLKVGVKVDVPKFGYKDPSSGKIEGFEVDIAKAVAKKIFGDDNKVELQGVNAKTRGPLVDNGEIDMVAATFTITEERKKSYNFSQAYFKDGVGLLVKKDKGISGLKDLNGKKIGVSQSSTTRKALEAEAAKEGIKLQFSEFGSYPEIKTALDSGRVDCFSVDAAILNGYVDDSNVILSDRYSPQEYGIASKKDNAELAKLIDGVIDDLKKSGELDNLIKKWGIK